MRIDLRSRPSAAATHARLAIFAALSALLLSACDRTPLGSAGPDVPGAGAALPPASALKVECTMDVRSAEMRCSPIGPALPDGVSADRIVGGQDLYVKLSSSGTGYDPETGIFRTDVTVQNLTGMRMGTPDGLTAEGIRIFFSEGPTATSGTGTVTVANPDGVDLFTSSEQPYFLYPIMLQPFEVSGSKEWQFAVPAEVETFAFVVFVSAELNEDAEDQPLLDAIWNGTGETTGWLDPANWQGGALPEATHSVSVPPMAMMSGDKQPVLEADAAVKHLRVGAGNSLDLGGHTMTIAEAVESPGEITNGLVVVSADSSGMVSGSLPNLHISGGAKVQRSVQVNGPLRVTGALLVKDAVVQIGS